MKSEPLTPVLLTQRELNHVLAGLRTLQIGLFASGTREIATNGGTSPLMEAEAIDDLCERINSYDPPVDTFAALLCVGRPGSFVSALRRAVQQEEARHPDYAGQVDYRAAAVGCEEESVIPPTGGSDER